MRVHFRAPLALVFLLPAPGLFLAPPAAALVTIEWVVVGHPGNAPDTADHCYAPDCGSVAEAFRIGKFEITNAQYVEFLNSVANETDPYGLYSPAMAGIDFPLVPIGFERFYELRAGFANKPVNQVSFYDALRFVNWMHNGQGRGDTETGAYTLVGGTATPSNVLFSSGGTIFLPSENEWYKAAYYDPSTASYFDYPAASNVATACTAPEATPNRANCGGGDGSLTDRGAYTGSASPYGTFDQGGNVWEWNEQGAPGSSRGLRGGSGATSAASLAASNRFSAAPTSQDQYAGFRVASPVPEADAHLLGTVALASLAARRRRRSRSV